MVTREQLITAEEFWEAYASQPYELVNGVLVKMVPTGMLHQVVATILIYHLWAYVAEHKLGYVGSSEGGYILGRNPDIVRGTDASFVSFARIPPDGLPNGYLPFAPDLAAEIVSPGDRAGEVMGKVAEYLAAGVRLVWVIYPAQRQALVYRLDGTVQALTGTDALDGEDVIPGFTLPLPDLWPPLPPQPASAP